MKTAQGIQENKPPFTTKAQPKEYWKNLNKYPTTQKILVKSVVNHLQTT